jgi:hypothetical protein
VEYTGRERLGSLRTCKASVCQGGASFYLDMAYVARPLSVKLGPLSAKARPLGVSTRHY